MSNTLSEYELEVRKWDDRDLAHALDTLNNRRGGVALYTSQQKKVVKAEASRRLRWGRKAEENNFHEYSVEVHVKVEATNEDEAWDAVEEALKAAVAEPMGVHWSFEMVEGSVILEEL